MKAKKKGSNDEWKEVIYAQLEGSDILYKEQYLEFQNDNLSTEIKTYNQVEEDKHWQEVRERAAIAAMQGLLSGTKTINALTESANEDNITFYEQTAIVSVKLADELVKRLKGE